MAITLLSLIQSDANDAAEKVGEAAGTVVAALLFIYLIVWLIKKYRKS